MAKTRETLKENTEVTVKDLGESVVFEKVVDGMRVLSYFPKKREGSKENLINFKQALLKSRS